MKESAVHSSQGLPASFRPLLWSLKWEKVERIKDREDIILAVVNEGTLEQWRWIIDTYGKETIRDILSKRLTTEFHPESHNLAKVFFDLPPLSYAR